MFGREAEDRNASSDSSAVHGSLRSGNSHQGPGDVTRILSAVGRGDAKAADQLIPMVYDELRQLAAAKIAAEAPGQTLQATALVHEAYIRLVDGSSGGQQWDDRVHFFSAAAEAMRRILIERARQKATLRQGGDFERIELEHVDPAIDGLSVDLIALDEALAQLEQEDPRKANLVKMRYFLGLTIPAAADMLGVAVSTAVADWAYARSWLRLKLTEVK